MDHPPTHRTAEWPSCARGLICGHSCTRMRHGSTPCNDCVSPCLVSCPHTTCEKPCSHPCDPCFQPCVWTCPHQGACERICAAPCSRDLCNLRCHEILSCGHRCPAVCGETCPHVDYCWHCGTDELKDAVVDMLSIVKYRHFQHLDHDPIIVLACGHFFCMSTLDGVMGLARDGFVKLEHSFVTPRLCPQCKEPIRGVKRYGKLQKVAELRLLERKHQRHNLNNFRHVVHSIVEKRKAVHKPRSWIKDLLKGRLRDSRRHAADLKNMHASLERMLREVGCGPMTRVNETIPVGKRLRPAEQRIDMYQTDVLLAMGRECLPYICAVAKNDVMYRVARGALQTAMRLTDASGSHRSGAEARLLLVEAFLADDRVVKFYWRFDEFVWEKEVEANELCQWIIDHWSPGIGRSLRYDAEMLKMRVADRERARVKRAADGLKVFGVTAGYSSNWYQCPNGHEYTIGDCGGPSQFARCPECGALIGGVNHVLTSDNSRVQHL